MAIRAFSTPGVEIQEIDQSDVLSPVSTSVGGIVLRSTKGQINKPVIVTSEKELVDIFGEPIFTSGADSSVNTLQATTRQGIPNTGYGFYAASKFLEESNRLYVARVADSADKYAGVYFKSSSYDYTSQAVVSAGANVSGAGVSCIPFVAGNQFDRGDYISSIETSANFSTMTGADVLIASVSPGTGGNDVAVTIETFSSACDWVYAYDDWPTSGSPDLSTNSTTQLIAKQVVRIDVYVKDPSQSWDTIKSTIQTKQSATSYTSASDVRALFPPTESFYGTLTAQIDGNGNQLLLTDIVNGNSKYIYVKLGAGASFGTTLSVPANLGILKYFDMIPLLGGTANVKTGLGDSESGVVNSTWDIFASRNMLPNVNILICPDWNISVKQKVAQIASVRMDCIAVGQTGDLEDTTASLVKTQEAYGYSNPSYMALYAGYNKLYDKYNDKFFYVPKAIFGANRMAFTDRVSNVWEAPAGQTRGIISSYGEKIDFTDAEIGQLYDRNINTSKKITGVGSVILGQKTAQMKKSALDRINVRRDLLFIENSIAGLLYQFLFEVNSDRTRQRITSIIDNFLADILAAGGLTAYGVTCDTTNNTPDIIDAHQLIVDIRVQPPMTIEFITLRTTIQNTGVSVAEIV